MTPENDSAPLAAYEPPGRIECAARSLVQFTRRLVGSKAVPPPRVDPKLWELPAMQRTAEVLRYSILRAEHWFSPGGTLRAVLRLSLKIGLLIGLPVLIIGPVILLLLNGAAAASALLATFAANLAALSMSLLTAAVGFAVLIAFLRFYFRRK